MKKSIDLNDGIDRRLKNIIVDEYGWEQDFSGRIRNGVIKLKIKSKKLAIIDPNLICDYFNEESSKKDVIHSNGVVIGQHECAGLLFKFNNSYRLFNFGFNQRDSHINFDDDIIKPIHIDDIVKFEEFETPFSNNIDTDVGFLSFIDFTDEVRSMLPVDRIIPIIAIETGLCEIAYEHISNGNANDSVKKIDSMDLALAINIKIAQQGDAPERFAPGDP